MLQKKDIKVLVVDDDPVSRELVSICFKVLHLDIKEAEDVRAAWALAQVEDFDIVLTEIRMPGDSGFELLKKFKSKDVFHPRIFFLTAEEQPSLAKIYSAGANGLIRKPIEAASVRQMVRESLVAPFLKWNLPSQKQNQVCFKGRKKGFDISFGKDALAFGRGGFCFQGRHNLLGGLPLEFDIELTAGHPIDHISGSGIVRWTSDKHFGVEIKYLTDDCRHSVINWIQNENPLAFIPA